MRRYPLHRWHAAKFAALAFAGFLLIVAACGGVQQEDGAPTPETGEDPKVRRTTTDARGDTLRFVSRALYSRWYISFQAVGPLTVVHSRQEDFAAETYSEIAELRYALGDPPKFDTLSANCNVAIEPDSLAEAVMPPNSDDFRMRLFSEDASGNRTVHQQVVDFMSENGIGQTAPAIIYYPELAMVDQFGSPVMLENGGLGIGPDLEMPSELEGTLWIHTEYIGDPARTTPVLWHNVVLMHELLHLVGRVVHRETAPAPHVPEGNWYQFINLVTSPGQSSWWVWNGRLASQDVVQRDFDALDLVAPIITTENGTARSQCDTFRADPFGYLLP